MTLRLHAEGDLDADDARTPVVLVHGFTESARTWDRVAERLRGRHRVIAVDLVGHGATDAPDDAAHYTLDAVVRQLDALAERLRLPPAAWVGYSLGGRVLLNFVLARPHRVRGLVLESASPGIADAAERAARRASDAELAAFARREGVPAFVDRWLQHPVFEADRAKGAAHVAALKEERLRRSAVGLARALEGLGQGAQEDLRGRLREVRAPTLLVAGARDGKYAALAAEMDRALPDSRAVILAGAGHAPHREDPAAFTRAIEGFLDAVTLTAQENSPWQPQPHPPTN